MNAETYRCIKHRKIIIAGLLALFLVAAFAMYQYGNTNTILTTLEEDTECQRIAMGLYFKFDKIKPESIISSDVLISSLVSHSPRYNDPDVITRLISDAPVYGDKFKASLMDGEIKKSEFDDLLLDVAETCSNRIKSKIP